MKSSKGRSFMPRNTRNTRTSCSRSHQRKEDDVADGRAIGQQHDETIDPDPFAGGRRKAVLERADVVLVHRVRLEAAGRLVLELRLEPPALPPRALALAEGARP